MSRFRIRPTIVLGAVLLAGLLVLLPAARALASSNQESMLQDDLHLFDHPSATLQALRELGVERVRVAVPWQEIAPHANSRRRPRNFDGSDPTAYPDGSWSTWDTIDNDAKRYGIALDFQLAGGSPLWATGPGGPRGAHNWEPSAREYGAFVRALGTRYSGSYDPALNRTAPGDPNDLPAVSFWSIWNEPDYGPSLAPQGLPGHLTIEYSPRMYRGLVDAAWRGLQASGHGRDTILFGEIAPRGFNYWGVFSGMKPLVFLRALYCVNSRYHQLRGRAAAIRGCPTTGAGSRRFRSAHPGLFSASGFADHPYMRWYPPNREAQRDPDYTSLGEIGNLQRALDRLQRAYGSSTRFPIYDTEFAYITTPPKHDSRKFPWVSQSTAAYYLNWAEYIHWRNPRLKSYMQYLLQDGVRPSASNDWGLFASGLLNYTGSQKPGYGAWRLPLYMPRTSARRGRPLEVWGCARPAHFAYLDTGLLQSVQVQFRRGSRGAFNTVRSIGLRPDNCYFDVRQSFPASGTVRLAYTFPSIDPQLGYVDPLAPHTIYSRQVHLTVR